MPPFTAQGLYQNPVCGKCSLTANQRIKQNKCDPATKSGPRGLPYDSYSSTGIEYRGYDLKRGVPNMHGIFCFFVKSLV